MLHGVRIEGGQAKWYRNRWVRTKKFEQDADAVDPATMMDLAASAANTHIIGHAGKILALEEGHVPYEIGPELETLRWQDYGGRLKTAFSAHPKLCPETGELHTFGYGALEPFLTYHVLDASGDLAHSAEIKVPGATMMHDFAITRSHAIFMDLPVVFDIERAMRGDVPIFWDESYGARIGILPRFGGTDDVKWFEIDPCYVFHVVNAFDEGSKVVADVGRHEYMWRDSMEDFAPSLLNRWTFDLETGQVQEEQLDDISHGFPRVDNRVVGLPYRYGWTVASHPEETNDAIAGAVLRYDVKNGTTVRHDFGLGRNPGEFSFVEASSASGEDEGWAMGFVYDAPSDKSELVILDGSNPAAAPVARIHLPARVPFGFHGSFIRD
jgi:carotenoid cleavage dioxygenase